MTTEEALAGFTPGDGTWRKARVDIPDGVKGGPYDCYVMNGSSWWGSACPYFAFEEAWRLARFNGGDYDPRRDCVLTFGADDNERDLWQGTTIEIDGREVKVYPVGHSYWRWEEVPLGPA